MKALFPASMMALALFSSGGCAKQTNEGGNAAPPATAAPDNSAKAGMPVPPTDKWIGRWNGPEGLFLDIQPSHEGGSGHYAIVNQDMLDRQADYPGVGEGSTIRFVRDGKGLAIRPGTGAETGFKYLADKKDCLIVIAGQEGYCR